MEKDNKKLIIITGPTASGKSSLAIKLAKTADAEIISADSMQVYKHMDIGTAKIKPEETCGVKHHLIDILEPEEEFNVCLFKNKALSAMEEIRLKGKLPLIVGGTGFYIQSVLYDVDFSDSSGNSEEIRKKLNDLVKEKGPACLHRLLQEKDPESAEAIHENNVKRVMRALEYFYETGGKISSHNREQRSRTSPYEFRYYVLDMPRSLLYERIDKRVDDMLKEGLVEEVRSLMNRGLTDKNISMQGLGYKELFLYLKGELSYEEAIRIIKRDTRHFAKRQLTWFKRERDVSTIKLDEFGYDTEKVIRYIMEDIGDWFT